MTRIAIQWPLLASFVALVVQAAAADDWDFYRYRDYGEHVRFCDELADRAAIRDLAHREAHRYLLTAYEHDRLHEALDRDAFNDYLVQQNYYRREYIREYNGIYPGYAYGYPTYGYPAYGYRYPAYTAGYSVYQPYVSSFYPAYPAYGSYYARPFSSRFGLYSPRWGRMLNFGP